MHACVRALPSKPQAPGRIAAGAEARMVLLEKDAARIRAGGAEAAARALAILAPADPLVLKAEIAIDSEKDREAIQGAIRGALERGRRRAKSGEG